MTLTVSCSNFSKTTTSFPPAIPIPFQIPLPTIPIELITPCEEIKLIPSSKPDGISTWIVGEVDQHSKCILKSKLMVDYLNTLEEYEKRTIKDASK